MHSLPFHHSTITHSTITTWMKAQDLQCFFVDLPCALRRVSLCTLLPVEAAAGQPHSAAGTGGLRFGPGRRSGVVIPVVRSPFRMVARRQEKGPTKENGQCFQVDDIYVICPGLQLFSLCCLHDIDVIFADCQDKS